MKVLVLSIFAFLFFGFSSYPPTQTDNLEKALTALREKDFNSAKNLIDQIITKNSFDAGGYYALAIYYADSDNKSYDYFKAFEYLILAEKYYSTLTTKEHAKLQKLGITLHEMQKAKQLTGQKAIQQAIASQSPAAIDKVLATFASLPDVVTKATAYKYETAFAEVQHTNTYQAYQNFFVKYPNAPQTPEAKEKYELLLFENLTADGSLQAYENFYKNYPSSPYRNKAKNQYERLYYEQKIKNAPTSSILEKYISDNPNSPYTEKAKNQLQSLSSLLPIRINNFWGFISGSGQVVIPPTFEKVGVFSQGLARIRKNGKWGYINTRGVEVIPAEYEAAQDFSEGTAAVMERKHKMFEAFYINTAGKILFNKVYATDGSYWPIHSFKEGLAAVEDPAIKKIGFVDKKGSYIISPLFDSYIGRRGSPGMYPFSSFANGYAWVKNDQGGGLIDTKGTFLIKGSYTQSAIDSLTFPPYYYRSFSDSLCLVDEASSSFYIDLTARKAITIPVGFTAMPFNNGVAWTRSKYDKKLYLIDSKGRTILDMNAAKVYPFQEEVAVIQKEQPTNRVYFYDQTPDPTYSFINKSGKNIFDFKFDIPNDPVFENSCFKNGIACIILNGKQTYITDEGKILWQSPEGWY